MKGHWTSPNQITDEEKSSGRDGKRKTNRLMSRTMMMIFAERWGGREKTFFGVIWALRKSDYLNHVWNCVILAALLVDRAKLRYFKLCFNKILLKQSKIHSQINNPQTTALHEFLPSVQLLATPQHRKMFHVIKSKWNRSMDGKNVLFIKHNSWWD